MPSCWIYLVLAALLAATSGADARTVSVHNTGELISAVRGAAAGDDIVLADGSYPLRDKLNASTDGTEAAPITVRAEHRWKASIRSGAVMAFEVTAPHWVFRDLDIRGACNDDSACEHAFHVVGNADGFQSIGNRLVDFNAQIKVNAAGRVMPSHGLIEGNEIFDTRARKTGNTVAKLNIDGADDWVVRGNLIYDFHKAGGDGVSYGAYVKGGSTHALLERNLVICQRSDDRGGARVGLSFGGGGTGAEFCAPSFDANTPCDPEVAGGVMRNNIVADCSDVGIYLNAASDTQILFNTLLRTHGIDFRFPSSTGEARGNVLASEIRSRDNGSFKDAGNMSHMLSGDLEAWYRDPDAGDLRLKAPPTRLLGAGGTDPRVTNDFCGRPRTGKLDMGALQSSLGDCPTLPQN